MQQDYAAGAGVFDVAVVIAYAEGTTNAVASAYAADAAYAAVAVAACYANDADAAAAAAVAVSCYASAKKKNQKETADICKKQYLPIEIWNIY